MKSLAELQAIRDKARAQMGVRKEVNDATRVLVGMATCGIAAGARPVLSALVDEVAKEQLEGVIVGQTGCIGLCQYEPIVEVIDKDQTKTTYVKMTPERAVKVLHQHVMGGEVVQEFTIGTMEKK